MTFEELKQEFEDNGFQIEGNSFVHVFEDPHTSINGMHPKKRFEMVYAGEGSVWTVTDDSDSDMDEETLYQFDILGPDKKVTLSICITSFEDFKSLV